MSQKRASRFILAILLLAGLFGLASVASALSVDFAQPTYNVRPGDSIDLVISFSEPVPNGLDGYAIQLNFDNDLLEIDPNQITVPPELDFDLFEPGAATDTTGSNYASVAGNVEFLSIPYSGTLLATRPAGWRWERDSNPRDRFRPNGFQDHRDRPLCHPTTRERPKRAKEMAFVKPEG